MDDRITTDRIEAAHGRFHKTRCALWLAATGNRPVYQIGVVAEGKPSTSPAEVRRTAARNPNLSCDIHPVEP